MGLLDGFMPQQNPYGANDDQQKAALLTGLLSAGFGALTGRRGAPLNAVGRAGLLGLGGYSGALDSAQKQNMTMAQLEEAKATGLLNRQNMMAQIAEREGKLARERGVQGVISGLQPPPMIAGQVPDGMSMPQGQISPDMIASALLQKGYADEAGKYAEIGNKLAPKTQVIGDKLYQIGPDGLKELGGPGKQVDSWSEPYQMGGATVQRNERTGEIRTAVSRPPVTNVNVAAENKTFKNETDLRKEWNDLPEVKKYKEVLPIVQSAKNAPDTPAGDLDLIYAVGKTLDPASVVREGELSLVIKSGSPLQRFKGTVNYITSGRGRLPPEQRQELLNMLQGRVSGLEQAYSAARATYEPMATRSGLNPQNIFTEVPVAGAPQGGPATPTPKGRRATDKPGATLKYDANGNQL